MVLSNKKLKQKLRSLVSESLSATETQKPQGDANEQLESLRERIGSKSRRPNSSKRPKRNKNPTLLQDSTSIEGIEGTQKEKREGIDSATPSKREKRKREGDGDEESENKKKMKNKLKLDKLKEKLKKKKAKKKRKMMKMSKDEKVVTKNEEEIGGVSEGIKENVVEEAIKKDESEKATNKVYVGGIPYYSSEDDIRSFFEGCGTITEIDCMLFPESGKFRGIAILTFKTEAAAKRALALDGSDMGGFFLKIQPYKSNRAQIQTQTQNPDFAPEIIDGYNRIYVGNLSWDVTEDDLKNLFSGCQISSIRFGIDKETGEFKCYGHIDFSDSESLKSALKLDQEIVCGRPVKISCAVPKKTTEKNHVSKPIDVKVGNDGKGVEIVKRKKRRTCYECGIPGHLAGDCLRKRVKEVGKS